MNETAVTGEGCRYPGRCRMIGEARSLSESSFVARQRRCWQMQGRRFENTGGVFTGIRWGCFRAENDADASRSFAAV